MRRRDLLVGAGGAFGASLWPFAARASSPWGSAPAEAAPELLGAGARAERCLELFLYGGLAPFESFYVVEDYGRPEDPDFPNQQWYLFDGLHEPAFGRDCGFGEASSWLSPFALDALGKQVMLGPVVSAFKARPDILARMRVVVTRHELEPHEAAIPYMLGGQRLGNPRLCGLGAHVQRYFAERSEPRIAPYSYVFLPNNDFSTDNVRAAHSVGMHPGSARPLLLKVTGNDDLDALLGRLHLTEPERAQSDALLALYRARASSAYTSKGVPLRAPNLVDHDFALQNLANSQALAAVLGGDLLAAFEAASCADSTTAYKSGIGLRAGVRLLTHPTEPARFVNVIDTGVLLADGGGGYDTHFEHTFTQATNTNAVLAELAASINEPGEGDPNKLDLDDTLVALTTEFGRTPFAQGARGTNHHPYGFVNVLIGGPIGEDQAGVYGAIGPDGNAVTYATPGELRAAMLVAMGIYPFAPESFAVGDVPGVQSELDGLVFLRDVVLGRQG